MDCRLRSVQIFEQFQKTPRLPPYIVQICEQFKILDQKNKITPNSALKPLVYAK